MDDRLPDDYLAFLLKKLNPLQVPHALHLIDLKRAGHSPRRTELNIPVDNQSVVRVATAGVAQSYMGSAAQMCEADAGGSAACHRCQ